MNINEVDKIISFLANKAQTANATPERRNLAYKLANAYLFKRYCGIPEQYQPGQPILKMAFSITADIEDVLRLFKVNKTLYINDSGIANLPDDFVKESTLTYINGTVEDTEYTPVDICNDLEFAERQYSYIVRATKEIPACRFIGTKIEFAPKNLVNAQLTYLRMPITPFWGFTIVNNRPVYDANTSVDPEWPDNVVNDFIMLSLQYLGVETQRQDLVQYTEMVKNKGE